jgi:hypothetical protein
LNAAARKKNKCALEAETKNIDKALLALEKRKRQCTTALERRRRSREQQQQQQQQEEGGGRREEEEEQQQDGGAQEQEEVRVFENTPVEIMRAPAENMRATDEATLDQYWDVNANCAQDILVLMLRMFLPTCGVLSKSRAIQWGVIKENILPVLSKAAMDAKQQEYLRRLDTIRGELAELVSQSSSNEDDAALDDVGGTVQ